MCTETFIETSAIEGGVVKIREIFGLRYFMRYFVEYLKTNYDYG